MLAIEPPFHLSCRLAGERRARGASIVPRSWISKIATGRPSDTRQLDHFNLPNPLSLSFFDTVYFLFFVRNLNAPPPLPPQLGSRVNNLPQGAVSRSWLLQPPSPPHLHHPPAEQCPAAFAAGRGDLLVEPRSRSLSTGIAKQLQRMMTFRLSELERHQYYIIH